MNYDISKTNKQNMMKKKINLAMEFYFIPNYNLY